ncbi:glycosyltransferase [Formosa sp. PL04]|uniref:glycosyltransferase n=1 Tax=Formosa sp. PL04 TaxID=3081755 RepID=UPI00298299B6|nr:glycosyltransferase [Formosa sp. PL04]MDW5289360.1 glycosyltransferase [Formosa sp. PL04]
MNYLLSIIIPVYNVEVYIEKCISSIINQTYENLEIIIINDGSSDSSGSICDAFANKDNRIKVYHITNGGSSIARNYGLTKCNGDYIGFVDSDDWIRTNMFESLINFAVDNSLKVVECSSIDSVFENKIPDLKIVNTGIIENQSTAIKRVIKYKRFAVWRRIYHKSILKNRFFIEHLLHQDVYFTIDILNETENIGFIDYPFYIYNRENMDSVIRSKYSIKKLNSIGAGSYVFENTKQYDSKTQALAKAYLFKFLTPHYNSLYKYNELDSDFVYRSKIRKTIQQNYNIKDVDFYSLLVAVLPSKLYKVFLFSNQKRIKFQIKIIDKLKNV